MLGQFMFATGQLMGLKTIVKFRNTLRSEYAIDGKMPDIHLHVNVFEEGRLLYENKDFGRVAFNGSLELSEVNCPALGGSKTRTGVVYCSIPPESTQPFWQEHHLIYENPQHGHH